MIHRPSSSAISHKLSFIPLIITLIPQKAFPHTRPFPSPPIQIARYPASSLPLPSSTPFPSPHTLPSPGSALACSTSLAVPRRPPPFPFHQGLQLSSSPVSVSHALAIHARTCTQALERLSNGCQAPVSHRAKFLPDVKIYDPQTRQRRDEPQNARIRDSANTCLSHFLSFFLFFVSLFLALFSLLSLHLSPYFFFVKFPFLCFRTACFSLCALVLSGVGSPLARTTFPCLFFSGLRVFVRFPYTFLRQNFCSSHWRPVF